MNTASPFFFMTCVAGIALLAGTVRAIKQNFIRQPSDRTSFVGITFFGVLEWLLWIATLIALLMTAPHPTTVLLLILFTITVVSAIRLRYVEEVRSMNRWLKLPSNASLTDLVESLADECRSSLAIQAKRFVICIHRGMSVADAARRSKFPVEADTIAAICLPAERPTRGPDLSVEALRSTSDSRELVRTERFSWNSASSPTLIGSREMTRVFHQFAYVVMTILIAWCFGKMVRAVTIPFFEQFDREFSFSKDSNSLVSLLGTVAAIGDVVAGGTLVLLLAGLLVGRIPFLPTRWVPWFGRRAIDRWRCEILDALSRGTSARIPADQIFGFAKDATRSRWVRQRCRAALESVHAGDSLPTAMRRSKLINATQEKWLASAQNNGNLPHAIEQLSGNIQRWQTLRWKSRVAWLVPIATFLVGLFVLAHAACLFQLLSELVLISL